MEHNTQTKSQLAKLMATENILVEHAKVSTASFNLKTRKLLCPIWKDMSGDLYDLLMGHEVGHALETPLEGWHDSLCKEGNKFKDVKLIKFPISSGTLSISDFFIDKDVKFTRLPISFGTTVLKLNNMRFSSVVILQIAK